MKNPQKIFTLVIIGALIIPQVTFAAWWNPATWGIFSFIFHTQPQVQTIITATSSGERSADISPNNTLSDVNTSTTTDENHAPIVTAPIKKTVKNVTPTASTPPATVQPQSPRQVQPTGSLCNGTYYSSCPTGQNLICPQTGSAYCQVPQQPTQQPVVQQQDGYQYCSSTYSNSIWDGSSHTSSGGFFCSCKSGYAPSSDSKSCQPLGNVYEAQDGNCYYSNGYDSNGSPLLAVCPAKATQPVSTGVNIACQTATQNLEKFQNAYAYGQNFGGIAADVASRLQQIFANEYNIELPAYQTAAQAACSIPQPISSTCGAALQAFNTFQAQYPLTPSQTSGGIGMNFALRFPAQQTNIQYACQ
ncbi:MAG: hypothetical protein WCG02_02830 [Candidatus Taylorbacteria bacterium]